MIASLAIMVIGTLDVFGVIPTHAHNGEMIGIALGALGYAGLAHRRLDKLERRR